MLRHSIPHFLLNFVRWVEDLNTPLCPNRLRIKIIHSSEWERSGIRRKLNHISWKYKTLWLVTIYCPKINSTVNKSWPPPEVSIDSYFWLPFSRVYNPQTFRKPNFKSATTRRPYCIYYISLPRNMINQLRLQQQVLAGQ